jgi:hypothetical protein
VYALNLTQSPEKAAFWECADPLDLGAGEAGKAILTSLFPAPRGPRQHRARQRRRSNQASIGKAQGSWRNIPDRADSSRVWPANVTGGGQKAPMRGMETGITAKV